MNNVQLIGNLTKDIELRKTAEGKSVVNFTLAVARTYDREKADFINCVAWNKSAELLHNYCKKGDKIGVSGSIQVRNYDNSQGQRVYVTEVLVDRIDLLTSRNNVGEQKQQSNINTYQSQNDARNAQKVECGDRLIAQAEMGALDIDDDSLPF